MVLAWAESSSSINNYRLKYYEKTRNSLSPESTTNVNERFISDESIRLSDLKANTEYEIELSAKQNTNGKYTESSNIGFTTLPDPVFGFGMEKSDLFSVKLSWYAPSHRIDYFELTVTEDATSRQSTTCSRPTAREAHISDTSTAVRGECKTAPGE